MEGTPRKGHHFRTKGEGEACGPGTLEGELGDDDAGEASPLICSMRGWLGGKGGRGGRPACACENKKKSSPHQRGSGDTHHRWRWLVRRHGKGMQVVGEEVEGAGMAVQHVGTRKLMPALAIKIPN